MTERKTIEMPSADPRAHPAVRAWRRLGPDRVEPVHVELLKRKAKGQVYRLVGAGPGGSAVIAKRCSRDKGRVERTIFEEVLPRIGVTRLEYHGSVEEDDGGSCWLFLEDGGQTRYSPLLEEHRLLASRWLATFHAAAESMPVKDRLPARGPDHYLAYLRSARRRISRAPATISPGPRDLAVLEEIVRQCDDLESSWSRVAAFCSVMPRTIVHGDCLAKNVHARTAPSGPAVVFLDWGGAGRGLPATDLGQLGLPRHAGSVSRTDYSLYAALVRDRWPRLDVGTVERLAYLGQTFWALKVISREAEAFEGGWARVEDTMFNLGIYASVLADSTRAAGWSG